MRAACYPRPSVRKQSRQIRLRRGSILDLGYQLSLVTTLKQHRPCLRDILKLGWNHSLVLDIDIQLAVLVGLDELLCHLFEVFGSIEDDDAGNLDTHEDYLGPVPHGHWLVGVVLADRAAGDDASVHGHLHEHQIEDFTSHVVVVDGCLSLACGCKVVLE